MRRLIAFPCAGETLLGTLDEAAGTTGLLIVSGGNELRIGAHRGQAQLAQRLAAAGTPVFRFDRRGIGDSTGENGGFASAAEDIAAAAALFRRETGVARLAAFGNCDAATALALYGRQAGIDLLILSNPWVVEEAGASDLPPAAAIRARYVERLRDPATWARLLRGGIDLRKLARGLLKLSAATPAAAGCLADRVVAGIAGHPARIILAQGDATAIAFADATRNMGLPPVHRIDTASHSYARPSDQDALFAAILIALKDN